MSKTKKMEKKQKEIERRETSESSDEEDDDRTNNDAPDTDEHFLFETLIGRKFFRKKTMEMTVRLLEIIHLFSHLSARAASQTTAKPKSRKATKTRTRTMKH